MQKNNTARAALIAHAEMTGLVGFGKISSVQMLRDGRVTWGEIRAMMSAGLVEPIGSPVVGEAAVVDFRVFFSA
jgi:hypothetical protein